MTVIIDQAPDPDTLADRAADWLVAGLAGRSGPLAVCLSGGSTPKRLYERLARDPWRSAMPYDRIHWFWGDERCVPVGDPRRNETMVRAALLEHVPVPPENIHPVPVMASPEESALAYEGMLKAFYGAEGLSDERPLFDIMLLGLGSDGHTASLFPGKPALAESRRWTAASEAGLEPFVPRVTLTFPALAASRQTAFLAAGADKTAMLKRVLAGDDLPAAHLQSAGPIHWFLDSAAMGDTRS